jgi:RimJ/RimL family protein N-acetyltransferase
MQVFVMCLFIPMTVKALAMDPAWRDVYGGMAEGNIFLTRVNGKMKSNFEFKQDYILEDDIVCLRPLVAADFGHLLEYAINEPDIWKYNAGGAVGAENLKKYIDKAVKNREEEKEYPFIAYDKRTAKYIGSTRFYNIDFERKIIEIGFTWYGKNYQGTGINKNCKYLLFDFAFGKLDMERIGMGANSKNERSINAMKSVGCTVEGIMRSRGYGQKGERIDSIFLSILKSEWRDEWKDKLKSRTIK